MMSAKSMSLQLIGFFVPKKPIYYKLIDLISFFKDSFFVKFYKFKLILFFKRFILLKSLNIMEKKIPNIGAIKRACL